MNKDLILKLADHCENAEDFNFDSIACCAVPQGIKLFDIPYIGDDWGDFHDNMKILADHLDIPSEDAKRLFHPHDDYDESLFNEVLTNINAIKAIRHYANNEGEDLWGIMAKDIDSYLN